ncbi:glycosyltransferase family 2 protein [Salegentibacter salarius]|uniref:Glycosyltransferase 2-like domain-containing protein n=1 Tax=Salegentibacter salarius TaxID=435906 RepID=A0A2N0TQ97_9FLAO|nr:glycosyltransferase [Salegentibacter salarius]OEY71661.1 hypothetical protein BHS39_04685 [Salegentibacter salarius]PKD16910.1 hypothetical protein APR40_04685 [Salegentibacter salarius]SLJ90803.1 Glycosyltransferase involved in cell wall bisynthesis [Salegentibacter salarius]
MDCIPNISVILPVFNGETFLEEAIESCLKQTWKNFELIIVDDCSSDNSLKIATYYANFDQRIKIISNSTNKKLPASLNIGHHSATGKYLTWTSDDNILKGNMLEVLLDNMIKNKADLVFSDYDIIEEDGRYRRTQELGPVSGLLFGNTIGASFLYKKKVFENLSGFDEDLYTLEDYDFWLRASIKFKLHHIRESLYLYRIHRNNLTSIVDEDPEIKRIFGNKHKIVYEKISNILGWSESTIRFLYMSRGFESWDMEFFKNNFSTIKNDLGKFQARVNANDKGKIFQKMDMLLRHVILNNPLDKKYIAWLLFRRPGILFDPHYSKKTSLKILKKYVDYN